MPVGGPADAVPRQPGGSGRMGPRARFSARVVRYSVALFIGGIDAGINVAEVNAGVGRVPHLAHQEFVRAHESE